MKFVMGITKQQSTGVNGQLKNEQRRFWRINANFVVSYYLYPAAARNSDMSLTRNIGLGGVCFTCDRKFKTGDLLHISLKLPNTERLIVFLGKVVYLNKHAKNNSLFDIGVKFVQAEDNDLFVLDSIIGACASKFNKKSNKFR
ncbi:MAG: PilZ domain-containing protein [Candidatus Omnitrophota bacterium]